jgi:hypothetical protein
VVCELARLSDEDRPEKGVAGGKQSLDGKPIPYVGALKG